MRQTEAKEEFKVWVVQKDKTDTGRRLEGTRVSLLMGNDSPESQIKA